MMHESPQIEYSQEAIQPNAVLPTYEKLTNPDATSRFGERIAQETERFDFTAELGAIKSDEDALFSEIKTTVNSELLSDEGREEHLNAINEKFSNIDQRQKEAWKLKGFLEMRERLWDTSGTMLFDSIEDEAQTLITGITNNAKKENSVFVPEEEFNQAIDEAKPRIAIDASTQPIEVPLSSIVSAVGFESWENGRGDLNKKDGKRSREVIQDYASRPTEIPPIEAARAVILPNGEVVIMAENSHRVAAAKLRNQQSIKIKFLTISRAKDTVTV